MFSNFLSFPPPLFSNFLSFPPYILVISCLFPSGNPYPVWFACISYKSSAKTFFTRKGIFTKKGFAERSKGIREKMLSENDERKKEKTYLRVKPLLIKCSSLPFFEKMPRNRVHFPKKGVRRGRPREQNKLFNILSN